MPFVARRQSSSSGKQVTAAEVALNGVREEARVGQRTTLDVAQCAAGPRQRPRGARHRATRPRRCVLYRAGLDRRALAANPRAQDRGLRPGDSLSASA